MIVVGDLVRVVKHPHCGEIALGHYYIVMDISPRWEACVTCGYAIERNTVCARLTKDKWCPLAWLKKVDPTALPATVTDRDEITA